MCESTEQFSLTSGEKKRFFSDASAARPFCLRWVFMNTHGRRTQEGGRISLYPVPALKESIRYEQLVCPPLQLCRCCLCVHTALLRRRLEALTSGPIKFSLLMVTTIRRQRAQLIHEQRYRQCSQRTTCKSNPKGAVYYLCKD